MFKIRIVNWAGDSGYNMEGNDLLSSLAVPCKCWACDIAQLYSGIYLTTCPLVPNQGPVVQSVVSLTSLLRVISLTVLADSIYNILIFFAEKM